ncbi:MAG TPA: FHA domain-containing protein [Thermoleophilaceae bacterium]|nr:FHA domain-containing protein [Thermoleophilaceae bacterium]
MQRIIRAEQGGSPFVLYRDESDELRIKTLANARARRTIGRDEANDVPLPWDWQVSRVHAELERIGTCWAVADDGLSTNGTFVNGKRIAARRRLRDGDSVQVGSSVLVFREPIPTDVSALVRDTEQFMLPQESVHLSPTQQRVLVALCRPFKEANGFATPATNQQIAEEVFLSVDRVKTHLRILFEKFELSKLPQNRKRLALVDRALTSGLVVPGDL